MRKIFTLLILLASPCAIADDHCGASPLNILLTNDDGVGTVGIEEMHRALLDSGHHIKRFAPNRNYSGSGASITRRDVTVEDLSTDEFPEVYAVGGSPASAVIFAASAMHQSDEQFDLIVSGINDGPNLGPLVTLSGTVGAVLVGMNILSVPGIAISTRASSNDPEAPEYRQHFANVAQFVARTVDVIRCDEPSLLNSAQALNINYPPLSPDEISGVIQAEQGKHLGEWRVAFVEGTDGNYNLQGVPSDSGPDVESADVILFEQGYITLMPFDGNYESKPTYEIGQILLLDP
jgi:5'-nucleotidase